MIFVAAPLFQLLNSVCLFKKLKPIPQITAMTVKALSRKFINHCAVVLVIYIFIVAK